MCVYRYQRDGSWSASIRKQDVHSAFYKNKIEWMRMLDDATGHKYQKAIYNQLSLPYSSLYSRHEISFWEYAKAIQKSSKKGGVRLLKVFIRFNFNSIYSLLKNLRRQ